MSFLSYIASDIPIPSSDLLWPLSIGGEDIYTEKQHVAEVVPDLKEIDELLVLLKQLTDIAGEIEVWRIWQGVEYRPVIRSKVISVDSLTVEDLRELEAKDVANETTTSYGIPVQYRIIVVPYKSLLKRFSTAEQEKKRGVSYALVANTASFAIGLWLAHLIPGIF